jgi:hypothetical protein
MLGMVKWIGAAAAVPLLVVACGGDSDDGGSGGSGGALLGGAAGVSGSGGSTTGGSGGTGGATGGTGGGSGGTITNECSPVPSQTAGSGGTDAGGVDSGVDASSGGSTADASTDGAATDGGPAPDASSGGTDAGTGGTPNDGGGASDGGGVPSIQCGSDTCTGLTLGGQFPINPCCSTEGCGLNLESSVANFVSIDPGCYAVGQAGKADATCPTYTVANPLGGTLDFQGCCRPSGECGFAIDTSGFGGPNLGCVPQACNGGAAKTCTP